VVWFSKAQSSGIKRNIWGRDNRIGRTPDEGTLCTPFSSPHPKWNGCSGEWKQWGGMSGHTVLCSQLQTETQRGLGWQRDPGGLRHQRVGIWEMQDDRDVWRPYWLLHENSWNTGAHE
jgi:hypothetical protein